MLLRFCTESVQLYNLFLTPALTPSMFLTSSYMRNIRRSEEHGIAEHDLTGQHCLCNNCTARFFRCFCLFSFKKHDGWLFPGTSLLLNNKDPHWAQILYAFFYTFSNSIFCFVYLVTCGVKHNQTTSSANKDVFPVEKALILSTGLFFFLTFSTAVMSLWIKLTSEWALLCKLECVLRAKIPNL